MRGAMEDIRVLDLTRVLAGPWCTQMFADMGADVVKIEHPKRGDDTRHWGPPYVQDELGEQFEDSTYYASTNRNKKSVAIDIATQEGAELVRKLAVNSDVFIENFKVGDLARYGLDYETIRKINPRIVYCSITGYGQSGPYASRPGYDFVFQAEAGLMSITGERDDLPGGGPQKVGVAIADLTTGLYASTAILAAINARHTTGVGQYIDMALLDCMTALSSNQGLFQLVNDIEPVRWGNAHPALVPYQVLKTQDASIVVAVGNDSQWAKFCKAIERDDLLNNPVYKRAAGRITNREALLAGVEETVAGKTTAHWLEALTQADVPHGRINNYRETFEHPQVVHREMVVSVKSEESGAMVKNIANPIKFSDTPVRHHTAAPSLGRHTHGVLGELLGLSDAELEQLGSRGVIGTANARKNAEITAEK
ncbi:CoA transferase [Alcaligenaceae bacterium]|nr:CoA transferase [Alcaligenaceae bacterium]